MARTTKCSLVLAASFLWLRAAPAFAQEPPAPAPIVAPPPLIQTPAKPGAAESPIAEIIEPRREGRDGREAGEGREGRERERGELRGEIETDRDSFTPSMRTVGAGVFVVESAYSFVENRRSKETHSLPEFLLRYGIIERVELRLGFNYEVGGVPASISGGEGGEFVEGGGLERETNINYGIKVAITEQKKWIPESMLIVQGFTPTSGPDPSTQYIVTYGVGWELPNRWKLDSALRFSEDSEEHDRFNIWAPSTVLKVPVGERWATHVEYFGEFSQNRREAFVKHFISPGVHFLVTPNLEVGVRLGWGLNEQSARFFSNAGFGWRF